MDAEVPTPLFESESEDDSGIGCGEYEVEKREVPTPLFESESEDDSGIGCGEYEVEKREVPVEFESGSDSFEQENEEDDYEVEECGVPMEFEFGSDSFEQENEEDYEVEESGDESDEEQDDQDSNSFTLFVGHVPEDVPEHEIRAVFEKHGDVIEVRRPRLKTKKKQREDGDNGDWCFVKFGSKQEADKALEALNGVYKFSGSYSPVSIVIRRRASNYHEDKTRVKVALKLMKVSVLPTWTLEDFKNVVKEGNIPYSSDTNLRRLFEHLVKGAKKKEVKKNQRLAKDFTDSLYGIKEITASSTWEECQQHFEESSAYRAIGEENIARDTFEESIAHLVEKTKEKERKREEKKARKEEKQKRKEKERREIEKDREERDKSKDKERLKKDDLDSQNMDAAGEHKEDKRERKHRKRHQDDVSSDKNEHREERDKSKVKEHLKKDDSDSHKEKRRGPQVKKRRTKGSTSREGKGINFVLPWRKLFFSR